MNLWRVVPLKMSTGRSDVGCVSYSGAALRDRIAARVQECLARSPQATASGRKSGTDLANEVRRAELQHIV